MTDRTGQDLRRSPAVDAHASMLAALDRHLSLLQGIRTELTAVRATTPGTRLDLVADSALSARRYLNAVESMLAALAGSEHLTPIDPAIDPAIEPRRESQLRELAGRSFVVLEQL